MDAILSLFGSPSPLRGVVCGTPVVYAGHRRDGKSSQCAGDGCEACQTEEAQHIVLMNLFLRDELRMAVVEGPGTLVDGLIALREAHEPTDMVVDIGSDGHVAVVADVDPSLASAVRTSRLHVLASRVPGSSMYAQSTPEPPPADRAELKKGLVFVHGMGMQTRYDLLDTTSRVLALTEELVASGHVNLRSLDARRERLRREESERFQNQAHVVTDATEDKYTLKETSEVPCAELLPICKGRCCRLHFSLSLQDVAEGVVEWELDRPYTAKKRKDGYCQHSCADTHGCTVYEYRPAVCRTYDCRRDSRVWLDYENRVPAPWEAIGGPGRDRTKSQGPPADGEGEPA